MHRKDAAFKCFVRTSPFDNDSESPPDVGINHLNESLNSENICSSFPIPPLHLTSDPQKSGLQSLPTKRDLFQLLGLVFPEFSSNKVRSVPTFKTSFPRIWAKLQVLQVQFSHFPNIWPQIVSNKTATSRYTLKFWVRFKPRTIRFLVKLGSFHSRSSFSHPIWPGTSGAAHLRRSVSCASGAAHVFRTSDHVCPNTCVMAASGYWWPASGWTEAWNISGPEWCSQNSNENEVPSKGRICFELTDTDWAQRRKFTQNGIYAQKAAAPTNTWKHSHMSPCTRTCQRIYTHAIRNYHCKYHYHGKYVAFCKIVLILEKTWNGVQSATTRTRTTNDSRWLINKCSSVLSRAPKNTQTAASRHTRK